MKDWIFRKIMEKNPSSPNSLAPFLAKTYEMVDDPSTNSMVSWSQNDRSFIVWNPPEFSINLLPKYFKHSNFSSFIRQLNTYGFRKIDPEKWEFAKDEFVRGKPNLLTKIHRRKPVHSHSLPNQDSSSSSPLNEHERSVYKEKIENLKQDKRLLLLELQKHKHERREIDLEMQALTETCINLEFFSQQRNIMSSGQSLCGLMIQDRKRNRGCFNLNRETLERLESWVSMWEEIANDVISSTSREFETESPPISDTLFYSVSKIIDMNVEPTGAATSDQEPIVRTMVNDVFWAQFLTENPIIESDKKNEDEFTEV